MPRPAAAFRRAALLLALAAGAAVHAQNATLAAEEPITAVRLAPGEHVPVDGRLTHAAWQKAPVFERSYEVDPVRGRTPDFPTRVRVLYDDRALYVGVEAIDPEPARIRAPLVRHDLVTRTQDFVVLYVDPIGARRAAQFFRAGASGSTADGLHTADDDTEDFSPDFDWDAASQRTDQGYTTVFRIPYASLRYSGDRGAVWRVMVGRRIPREQVMLTLSVPLPREALSFIDRLQPLQGFELPLDHGFVQWRPTLTLRRTEDRPFEGERRRETELKPSLDVKWRPRPELVLDATLNPDFSQVELDQPQLSRNNRFALFFTEKRPFFLESSDLLIAPTRSLYTRSISDPRWGVRATWRSDRLAGSGVLVQDRGGGLTPLPGAYGTGFALQPRNTALLSRAGWRAGDWSFGSVLAHRRYDEAGENTVGGLDAQWLVGAWRLKAQWLGSRTTAHADDQGGLREGAARDGHLLHLQALRRTDRTESELLVEDVATDFRNDAGFVSQAGVRHVEATHIVQWHNLGPFNEFHLYLDAQRTEDRELGQAVSQKWLPGLYLAAARNTEVTLEWVPRGLVRVAADRPLRAERYWHLWAQTTPGRWSPLASLTVDAGRLLDVAADTVRPGRRITLDVQTRLLPPLELQPRIEQLTLREGGRVRYRETAAQLLGIWHLAARQSLRLIVQRTRYERDAEPERGLVADEGRRRAESLTYAWRRSTGSVLYVGVTRGTDGLPQRPERSTEVFAKLQVDLGEWLTH